MVKTGQRGGRQTISFDKRDGSWPPCHFCSHLFMCSDLAIMEAGNLLSAGQPLCPSKTMAEGRVLLPKGGIEE